MKITNVVYVSGASAFYFDDQRAIKSGANQNGFIYDGESITPGFSRIRQAGECVSVVLILDNGMTAVGDCAAVQYSGAGGRDGLFISHAYIPFLQNKLTPLLLGLDVSCFKENAEVFDQLLIDGKRLHTAIRYGLSQALLDATAQSKNCLKFEILCEEYGLPVILQPIPLFGQSGDDRYKAVDKMVLKGVDALPHGLINNVNDKLGHAGEKLLEYMRWLAARVTELRHDETYQPDLHIDVYGTIGMIFNENIVKVADYIAALQQEVAPFNLYVEGPVDVGDKEKQIEMLLQVKQQLQKIGSPAKLVADEWCNTYQDIIEFADAGCCHMVQVKTPDLGSIHNVVESAIYCKDKGVEVYQGGTCNETDISARTSVHLALASRPERMLVKPGMGFDEGMTIVNNEMMRSLAIAEAKQELL